MAIALLAVMAILTAFSFKNGGSKFFTLHSSLFTLENIPLEDGGSKFNCQLSIINCQLSSLFTPEDIPQGDFFTPQPIPEQIWQQMQGKSYQPNPYIQRHHLRYIKVLHCDINGNTKTGEIIANKLIAQKLANIFQQLYQQKYPIQSIQLPENFDADDEKQMQANNTSCFLYRPVAGTNKLSKHAQGLAVDINPLYNPYVRTKATKTIIQPANAAPYTNRTKNFPYKITPGDPCHKLFIQNGFRWGGAWKSCKDYQHFEYRQ